MKTMEIGAELSAKVMKSRTMRWAGIAALMQGVKNSHKILVT
jgi:hypothetical protein